MLHNDDSSRLVNSPAEVAPGDFLGGADEIGRAIGRNGRQAFHLLKRGEIKSAKKVGGRWVVSRAALLRELGRVNRHVHDRVARRRAVRRVTDAIWRNLPNFSRGTLADRIEESTTRHQTLRAIGQLIEPTTA
jgi:hypothetical protein